MIFYPKLEIYIFELYLHYKIMIFQLILFCALDLYFKIAILRVELILLLEPIILYETLLCDRKLAA